MSAKAKGFIGSRALTLLLAFGLLGGGTVALAASGVGPLNAGSSKKKSAANKQYCPPTSQQPGKPKSSLPHGCGKKKSKKVTCKNKSKSKSKSTSSRKKSSKKHRSCSRSKHGKKKHGKKGKKGKHGKKGHGKRR
jgi:hypothetical protein